MHKYQWLENRLENQIQDFIREGREKLPSEQELCEKYQISRQTVRMALNCLEKKGLIVKKRGSGSYITGHLAGFCSNDIGILLPDDQDYLYPGLIHDIRNTLEESGFSGTVFPTANCVGQEREILTTLISRLPRGLIVEGCKSALPNPNLDLYHRLIQKGCHIVFLFNCYPALPECPFIKENNFSGSAVLVRHLFSQGHRAIAGIFKADDLQGVERYQGFMETLRDLDLPVMDSRICWYTSRDLNKLITGKDALFIREMVRETLSFCTAAVCHNDLFAYHLIQTLLRMGYSLPKDLAVAAFDNTYLSNSNIMTITTMAHHPHEMGTKAAQAIIRKLKGLPVPAQEVQWFLNQKKSTENLPLPSSRRTTLL